MAPPRAGTTTADLIGRGELAQHETPVFIHTGGSPIVFPYHEEMMGAIRRSV